MTQPRRHMQVPTVLSLIACERFLQDATSKRVTLFAIMDVLAPATLPMVVDRIDVYVELTDGLGTIPISVRLVRSLPNDFDGEILLQEDIEIDFADPREVQRVQVTFEQVLVRHAGEYRVVVHAAEGMLEGRRITVLLPFGGP